MLDNSGELRNWVKGQQSQSEEIYKIDETSVGNAAATCLDVVVRREPVRGLQRVQKGLGERVACHRRNNAEGA